ncbi:uncharacterized protein LOC120282187 [Dioscorea cayenensis subsp. rotundata]|uniref:Uncharacterized protein LOC120282187 n=1 Tax=Dioscorea cayennensis subsp. rotundata TaxID=55577 RepID=A0AB40CZP7_DIOCR|nr:uncharacterized protein LOC120282187 [Dioscorea cayenensis subsp. rotundata]
MKDLEVHTLRVITEGSKHPPELERPFTRLRKKTKVGTSGIQQEDFDQILQERAHERAKSFSQAARFQTPPRRNNDSSEEEDDNLIFTLNKDPVFARLKKQLDQREKDHISMMQTIAYLTGVHRQAPSVQVIQEEEDDEEEVLGLHEQAGTSAVLEPTISPEEIQKIVAAQLKQAKGATLKSDGDKPYSSFHDQVAYPKGYNVSKFKKFNGLGNPDQHLAYFIIACGDTSNNPSLLLRQFAASLTGVAFEWYANLQPESIQRW